MAQRYVVSLEEEEREQLSRLIHTGKGAARKLAHARILLRADRAMGEAWPTDEEIADSLDLSVDTVERVRRRFVEEGLDAAIERKPSARAPRLRVIDGEAEAKLIALNCGGPPEGRARWTLRLLADKLVELEIVEHVSHETVRVTLKKTNSSPGASGSGAFRPNRTRPSPARWKTCSKHTACRTTPSFPSSAWTRRASS
jgi:transposase